jgi:hypothetical protein
MTKEQRKTAKQYLVEERRKQVGLMTAQGISGVEMAAKLGVGTSTISTDIKALKLISQQFIYDITKSDFTFYYKLNLDMTKQILRKQCEIVEKERITKEDMWKSRILADMLNTINTINEYYNAAPSMHQSPMQKVLSEENFGIRPGTPELTQADMEAEAAATGEELHTLEEWDAIEEAELEAQEAELKAPDKANNFYGTKM